MDSKQDILSYLKQKTLKNAFPSERDFSQLFPSDNFDFSKSDHTHFIYFSSEEAVEYVKDYLLFIKSYYNDEIFSYNNYFSVFDEFKKHCENNKIFLYTKTMMGLNLANYSNELLLSCMQSLFGANMVQGNESGIAFNDAILQDKESFTYPFFYYLFDKVKGYNFDKFIVEPLVNEDLERIRNYYKGVPFKNSLPFYLNPQNPYWKENKTAILNSIVSSTPTKTYNISEASGLTVALVIAEVEKDSCSIEIISDSEYYNSDLSYPIDFICRDLFDNYEIKKITTVNNNKGIAFSGINSTLTMSRFKPSYNSDTTLDGFSKIKYEITRDTAMDADVIINNSLIKFAF